MSEERAESADVTRAMSAVLREADVRERLHAFHGTLYTCLGIRERKAIADL